MIGTIDVMLHFTYGFERVTLGFYSSSGTNNGKIKTLWYPIVGIKLVSGPFVEFTPLINSILSHTTQHSSASKGWLAKSLFFYPYTLEQTKNFGFSHSSFNTDLYAIGQTLRYLYLTGAFIHDPRLKPSFFNKRLTAESIYPNNTHTQKENFEVFISEIYNQAKAYHAYALKL